MKKRLLVLIMSIAAFSGIYAQEVWPDGSPMDSWFTSPEFNVPASEAVSFVITDYGVKPDSPDIQTSAIQAVIDKAAEKGGTVVIPAGTFNTASLFFKQGTHLYLEKGALLKGSDDISDYPVINTRLEGQNIKYIAALINAIGVDGFSIRGEGTIDGNGAKYWRAFWKRREVNPKCTNLEALRPRLIYIAESQNICLEGVKLQNTAFWTTHLYKCNRVQLHNLDIYAPTFPVRAASSDAIDVDVCTYVHIFGCRMSVSDDLIALKGGKGPWADKDPGNGGNFNILVEDCYFGRGGGLITCGSESIHNRNVIVRNCVMDHTPRMLNLKMRPDTPQKYEYMLFENVTGTCTRFFAVQRWTQFFDLKGREDIPKSYASHITIRNCRVDCDIYKDVVEKPEEYELSDIVIENNQVGRTTAKSLFWRSDSLEINEIISKDPIQYTKVGHHGPAVENTHSAFRVYFNDSGAIDVYSKSGKQMELLKYLWYPTEKQMAEEGAGCDEYLVGSTVGIGGIALWDGEKEVKLVATNGRTARAGETMEGSFAEIVSYGVPYKGDKVDISVRVDVFEGSRSARVTATELSGKEVQFLTGVNYHPGEALKYGKKYVAVWGVHPSDVSQNPIPLGAGLKFDPKLFSPVEKTADMLRIISKPASTISTTVEAASTKEKELGTKSRFFSYMAK